LEEARATIAGLQQQKEPTTPESVILRKWMPKQYESPICDVVLRLATTFVESLTHLQPEEVEIMCTNNDFTRFFDLTKSEWEGQPPVNKKDYR
jgi:hypothetical protein